MRKALSALLIFVAFIGIANSMDQPWLNSVSYKAGPFTVHVNIGSDESGVISTKPTQEQNMTIYRAYIGNIGIQLITQQATSSPWTNDSLAGMLISSGCAPNSIQTIAYTIDGHPGIIGQGSVTADTPHLTEQDSYGRSYLYTYTTFEVFKGAYNVTQNTSCIVTTTGNENFDQFMSAINTIHVEKTLPTTQRLKK